MADIVYVIRHAEKPLGAGPPSGVDVDGNQDAESLTPLGWQRAGALVHLFAPGATLLTPTHLFASSIGPGSSSRRPQQTLGPLAARLGLEIDSRFLKPDIAGLAAAAVSADGVVLIAWEHQVIPALTNGMLGGSAGVPQIWPSDRFDMVWSVDLVRRELRQIPEMLLAGDRSDLFPI